MRTVSDNGAVTDSGTRCGRARFWAYLGVAILAVAAGLIGVNVMIDQAVADLAAGSVTLERLVARFALPPVLIAGLGAAVRVIAHLMKTYPRRAASGSASSSSSVVDLVDFTGKAAALTAFVFAAFSAFAALARLG